MRDFKSYVLGSAIKVRTIASSTADTPIVVTYNSHGYVTGDMVVINGHATNTAANGTWTITKLTANTFSLDGSVGNGIGGNTGALSGFIKPILVEDFRHLIVSIATDSGGDAAMTVKCVGSIQDTCPDFGEARSVSNDFEFIQMVDLQANGSSIGGDTGFVVVTADDYRLFAVNVNGLKWLSFLPTAGTEGEVTIKLLAFYDGDSN
jgi:hypothetical protein